MACKGCPFGYSDDSDIAQSLGCLPDPYRLIEIKKEYGHNWSCHQNDSKVCSGMVEFIADRTSEDSFFSTPETRAPYEGIDMSTGKLMSYTDWEQEGEEYAIKNAK